MRRRRSVENRHVAEAEQRAQFTAVFALSTGFIIGAIVAFFITRGL